MFKGIRSPIFAIVFIASATQAATPGGASANYALITDTADCGGVRTSSANYTAIGSAGGIEGAGTSTNYSAGHGYIAQLYGFPTISTISPLTIQKGSSTSALPFTVGDDNFAAAGLTLTCTFSNNLLQPTNTAPGFVFGGAGAARNVTLTPAATQFGSITVTVTVFDSAGGNAKTTFVLTVNAPPVQTGTLTQTAAASGSTSISFLALKVTDPDQTPANLIYTLTAVPAPALAGLSAR